MELITDKLLKDWTNNSNPCGEILLPYFENDYAEKVLTRRVLFEKTEKYQWMPIMSEITLNLDINTILFQEQIAHARSRLYNILRISDEDLFWNNKLCKEENLPSKQF